MTDQQLLDLLAQTPPEDLSAEQSAVLQHRLVESPALRKLLIDELGMASYVEEALRRHGSSLAQVAATAAPEAAPRSTVGPAIAYVLACLAIAYGGALWVHSQRPAGKVEVVEAPPTPVQPQPSPDEPAPAENPPADPTEPPPSAETAPPPTPAVPPAAEPVVDAPWAAVLARKPPLPTIREIASDDFDTDKFLPRQVELKRWFQNVPGMTVTFRDTDTKFGKSGAFNGFMRCLAPFHADTALRFSLERYNHLQIHFFNGDHGLTLIYYEDADLRWQAYTTQRKPGAFRPTSWALTASDGFRTIRSGIRFGGPLELRCTEGEVLLSRGDLVVLRAPFEGPPTDVFFDGGAEFYGIQLVRTQDLPAAAPATPVTVDIERPADREWTSRAPQILKPELLPDGGVRLATATPLTQRVEAYTPLPTRGLQEVILQLEDITPGAGVYLGRQEGAPYEVIRFQRNPRSEQLIVGPKHWDDVWEGEGRLPPTQPTAAALPRRQWVRLIFGIGMVSWQLSTDGLHWGQFDHGVDWTPGDITSVGLQLVANRGDTNITLRRIQIRELPGLAGLTDPALLERATAAPQATTLGAWLAAITAEKPADVSLDDWRRACAVKRLGTGINRQFGSALIECLLDDAALHVPTERYLTALQELGRLLIDYRDNGTLKIGLQRRFLELATRGRAPFAEVWRKWLETHIGSLWLDNYPLEPFVRAALVHSLHTQSPAETLELTRKLKFYHLDDQTPLVRWAEFAARRELPNRSSGELTGKINENWHHPYVEDLSKEAYNLTAELRALLTGDNADDAARQITQLQLAEIVGLAPVGADRALLASAPAAVRSLVRSHPDVERILTERYDKLARLRFEEASAAGDVAGVELAALLFGATEAGAEAHKWLGDRALVNGWFDSAVTEYRRALEHASTALAREIEPRLRLTAALGGKDAAAPITHPVQFGETNMTGDAFEALVKELRERADPSALRARGLSAVESRTALPQPAGFQVHARGKLDGPVGERANEEGARHVNHLKVPWLDRQLAAAIEGDTLYVSNRFQLAAYRLTDGGRAWQTTPPPGQKNRRSQDLALIAMRPLVFEDRIVVRQLYGDGQVLSAFRKSDGAVKWTTVLKDPEQLASDPFSIRGRLVALTALRDSQEIRIRWTTFDPETGLMEEQRDLVRLLPRWLQRPCGEVTVTSEGAVINLGGCVVQTDPSGDVRWVRRTLVTPEDEDSRWILQEYQPPILDGDRVFIAQPGMRSVECLDVSTGSRRWSAVLPEVNAVLGISRGRLIVKLETELLALDANDGSVVWRQPMGESHPTALCGDDGLLLIEREKLSPPKESRRNQLTWRNPDTGEMTAAAPLKEFDGDDPRLGLLLPHKDRLWLFAGKGQTEVERTLMELVPHGEAEKMTPRAASPWRVTLPSSLARSARERFPGWELLSAHIGDQTGVVPEIFGEKDVLGLRVSNDRTICWTRVTDVPAADPKLKLRIGADDDFPWKLAVYVDGQTLKQEDVRKDKLPGDWHDWELNLSDFAGKSVVITIEVISGDAKDFPVFWKRMEIVP